MRSPSSKALLPSVTNRIDAASARERRNKRGVGGVGGWGDTHTKREREEIKKKEKTLKY